MRQCSMFVQELSEEIEDYTQRFNTEDQLEWNLVLQEVAAFVEVRLYDQDGKGFYQGSLFFY